MAPRPLNVGMIGGGAGAFIGNQHQRAIFFDGTRRVTAAALRSNPKAALADAKAWPYPIKGYATYDEMLREEVKLPLGERVDYVLIVTPNNAHYDPAMKCIKAGIPVFCEKPLTFTVDEAKKLAAAVKKAKIPFGVAHTYIGHWTSRLSRQLVRSGLLGKVRWVDSFYLQGWLADSFGNRVPADAMWRVDPKRSGASGCGGDIGTHALMQLRYVTGLEIKRLSAQLERFINEGPLDDHFTAFVELGGGAKGLVRASQIAIGHKNDLGIEICGEKGTLAWRQEEPEKLTIMLRQQPDRVYWRGAVHPNDGFLGDLPKDLMDDILVPFGHPEGFHDAFARLHRAFEKDVRAYQEKRPFKCDGSIYANVDDGLAGMKFIQAAVRSSKHKGKWVTM